MTALKPRMLEADKASTRMNALCEFIEHWLGPREEEYGESALNLDAAQLPMPLRRIYEFAGRWPGMDQRNASPYAVGAFSTQDVLLPLAQMQRDDNGRISFLAENQGNWVCYTKTEGDDPPVWCSGDFCDAEQEEFVRGDRIVCDSLSRFLVTFVLQELTLGSRLSLSDRKLSGSFEASISDAVPIWLIGPNVSGSKGDYYLWNDALVANLWGGFHFAANTPAGINFLTSCQGPVAEIYLKIGLAWYLHIRKDGSTTVRYEEGTIDQIGHGPTNTISNFEKLADRLSELYCDGDRGLMVFFVRDGQSSSKGRSLADAQIASGLFRMAITAAKNPQLDQLFHERWPYI